MFYILLAQEMKKRHLVCNLEKTKMENKHNYN